MISRKSAGFFLVAILGLASLAGAGSPRPSDEITWLDNYSEALREAKQTGKPIFLEFRCEA
jgi:hypothetical protein